MASGSSNRPTWRGLVKCSTTVGLYLRIDQFLARHVPLDGHRTATQFRSLQPANERHRLARPPAGALFIRVNPADIFREQEARIGTTQRVQDADDANLSGGDFAQPVVDVPDGDVTPGRHMLAVV